EFRGRPSSGVWLGVDVGAVRIGVARSDPAGVLAVPLATVPFDRSERRADLAALRDLVAEHRSVGVVVGLPRTLAGREGPAAAAARAFGEALRPLIAPVEVRYSDERMTTVLAQRNLSRSGVRTRAQRAVIDQAAAVEILQSFLAGLHRGE
ncbi:MAG TPA: Holliday junction resolvase RuvX, partial [Jatrophihabitans sp.]|nr:Holliday junction resolvase RuvX [Jatrophihabitans sp.]